ncbi:MAG: DNA-3-methyladenine glycosylase [Cyanobacteria bacterium P01_H01_bin.121]
MNAGTEILAADWFARPSVDVAPALLGCTLVRRCPDGQQIRGVIVETEAYEPGDPACHGYRKKTPRNAAMFGPPGQTYVYLIYGMYYCLNIVTAAVDVPSAVLIRALEPLDPLHPWQSQPQAAKQPLHRLAAGPGKLCRVLAIDRQLNERPLVATEDLWVEAPVDVMRRKPGKHSDAHGAAVTQTTRIGLTQGADIPWRWYWTHSRSVSRR